MNTTYSQCDVDTLNQLLRGEISAVETYDQAVQRYQNMPAGSVLRRIRDEHLVAVATLRNRVTQFGGEPSTTSGAWGAFASAVTGTAKVIGSDLVFSALKKGEDHGVSQYEAAIADEQINAECKEIFRTSLLPQCLRHIAELGDLEAGRE